MVFFFCLPGVPHFLKDNQYISAPRLKDSVEQHINSGPPFTVYAMDPAFPEQIWEPPPLLQNTKRLLQRWETLVTISSPYDEKNY